MSAVLDLPGAGELSPPSPSDLGDHAGGSLAAVLEGDRRARRDFVRGHQRAVFAVISRVLGRRGTRELVEDLAQETFLRAFRALPDFDPRGEAKVSTWVLRIATNAAIDELRKKTRVLAGDALTLERLPSAEATDGQARRVQAASLVVETLEVMAPEYRAAFVLRAFHHLSHAEIANVLGLEIGTVKSRIARARRRLKTALAEVYDER